MNDYPDNNMADHESTIPGAITEKQDELLRFYTEKVNDLALKLQFYLENLGLRAEVKVEVEDMEMAQDVLDGAFLHVPWVTVDDFILIPIKRLIDAKHVPTIVPGLHEVLFWEVQQVMHIPGTRYHKDGSGTPDDQDHRVLDVEPRDGEILQTAIVELVKVMIDAMGEAWDYRQMEQCACTEEGHEHPDENAKYLNFGLWDCGKTDQH